MADPKNPSLIKKILSASEAALDLYIAKARSDIASEEDDAFYRKSVYKDISYATGSQGYQEKTSQLSYQYQSQMARRNTIVSAIIQTLQNKVASHAIIARDKHSKGFRIKLKNEEAAIQEIMEEMFGEKSHTANSGNAEKKSGQNQDIATAGSEGMEKARKEQFAFDEESSKKPQFADEQKPDVEAELAGLTDDEESINPEGDPEIPGDINGDKKLSDREKRRVAKEELQKRNREKIEAIQETVLTCGSLEDRPFESRKWNFDAFLRAIVRDRLTYDQIATEIIPDQTDKLHHWVPVDGGTIRYASPALSKYKDLDMQTAGYDLLYPEKELKAMEEQRDTLELDEEKLKNEDYKFVQVVRGRIVRAFTPDEMAIGMANPTTDIYANGYSISELELLLNMVSAHIFTENYNRSYFTQGFSAKGILHIKAPLNRRKLETVRVQWNHMLKGNRNSFQTPIMSGMDDVKWIPLTQNHSDMEFNNWMNYLIKIICAIYQIDPFEIGFGMKDEGGSGGGGLSGDNSEQKIEVSKNKGFVPLMTFLQNYINTNIISRIDPDFELEFVGLTDESRQATLNRQKEEVKFKKSVNEIRAEDDLPPIDGADDLILDPTYMTWFTAFHPDGKKMKQEMQQQAQGQMMDQGIDQQIGMDSAADESNMGANIDSVSAEAGMGEQAEGAEVQQGLSRIDEQLDSESMGKPAPGKKPLKKSMKPKVQKISIEHYVIKGK